MIIHMSFFSPNKSFSTRHWKTLVISRLVTNYCMSRRNLLTPTFDPIISELLWDLLLYKSVLRVHKSVTAENWERWRDRQLWLNAFHPVQTPVLTWAGRLQSIEADLEANLVFFLLFIGACQMDPNKFWSELTGWGQWRNIKPQRQEVSLEI